MRIIEVSEPSNWFCTGYIPGGAHQKARAFLDEGAVGDVVTGTAHVMSHRMEDGTQIQISFLPVPGNVGYWTILCDEPCSAFGTGQTGRRFDYSGQRHTYDPF